MVQPGVDHPDDLVELGTLLVGILATSALVGILVLLLFALREITRSGRREANES